MLHEWLKQVITNKKGIREIQTSEERIIRAYKELLSGYETDPSKILNVTCKTSDFSGLVKEMDIQFTSFCGHHFLPFFGTVDVIYEPGEIITGLGKIPRLVQAFSKRFQIQEFLNKQIAQQIVESIGAKGVFVRSTALHLCMHSRGPSDRNVKTVCTYGIGTLEGYKD